MSHKSSQTDRKPAEPREEQEWWRRRESNPGKGVSLSFWEQGSYEVRFLLAKVLRCLMVYQNYAEFIRVLPLKCSRIDPVNSREQQGGLRLTFVSRIGVANIHHALDQHPLENGPRARGTPQVRMLGAALHAFYAPDPLISSKTRPPS
jgi:hypothetical protein